MTRTLIRLCCYCLLAVSSPLFATTTYLTGRELADYCKVTLDIYDHNFGRVQTEPECLQEAKSRTCRGYLISANEHYFHNQYGSCPPNLLRQAAAVVKYLDDHPCQQNLPASFLILKAYEKYFPL